MKFATKLFLLFSGLFLVLCVFITLIVISTSTGILERNAVDQMEARAFFRLDMMDRVLYERYQDMLLIADDPVFVSAAPSPEVISERLKRYLRNNPEFTSLSFFDLSRKRIADTAGKSVGRTHSLSKYWPAIESGKDSVTDLHFSESYGEFLFHFAVVVKDGNGRRTGVVVGRILPAQLTKILEQPSGLRFSDGPPGEEGLPRMDLVNREGLLLYSNYSAGCVLKCSPKYWDHIRKEVLKGAASKGYRLRDASTGEEEIVSYSRERGYGDYRGNGWTFILHVPAKMVFSGAEELRNRLLLIYFAVGGAGVLAISLFSRTVSKPIVRLSEVASAIGKGDLEARAEARSKDEVGGLAQTVNQMAQELSTARNVREEYAKKLEREVSEREKALNLIQNISAEVIESNEKYQGLFENSVSAVAILDAETFRFEDANPACLELFGYSKEEFHSLTPLELSAEREMTRESMKALAIKGDTHIPLRYFKKRDGTVFPMEIFTGSFYHQGRKKFIATALDLTEKKRAEEAILQAKNEAEAATRLKDKFVSLLSHDLKGPLASMTGFLKLLREEFDDQGNGFDRSGAKLLVESSIRSGEGMAALIDSLLDLGKLRTGKITPRKIFIDPRILVEKAMSFLGPQAEKKGITVVNRIPNGTRIYADPTLLAQVLQNLLSNAIKFSHSGGTVTIFNTPGEPSAIAVADEGVGMQFANIEEIFKYDKKCVLPGTAGESGNGIGLPLAKEIVEAHQGTLSAESSSGKGSVFYVRLPQVKPVALVAHRDPRTRETMKNIMARCLNAEVMEAKDSGEAHDVLANSSPHLVLVDAALPGLDRVELLKRVKGERAAGNAPLVLLIADHDGKPGEDALRAADDVLQAGADEEEIVRRASKLLFPGS